MTTHDHSRTSSHRQEQAAEVTTSFPIDDRGHRRLVLLGKALLAIGPILALIHALTDAQSGGGGNWWTYTIAGYDTAIITMIIGAALVWRSPPGQPE